MANKNSMNHKPQRSTNNSSCTTTPISTRWVVSSRAPKVKTPLNYGKLGAVNKASRLLTVSADNVFERWPFPFIFDLNASQQDGTWSIWTCPVTQLNTKFIFGTLIELLGSRNEGWARNSYCGLVDIIEHGNECQVIRGLDSGGFHRFYRLFNQFPNVSQTWDGFAAGLDILERLVLLSPETCRMVARVLPYILRPICKHYRQREGIARSVSLGKSVRMSTILQLAKSSTNIKKCLMGASKFPFLPDLQLWLCRLQSLFATCLGEGSSDFLRVLSVMKRMVPDFECALHISSTNAVEEKIKRRPRASLQVYEAPPTLRRSIVGSGKPPQDFSVFQVDPLPTVFKPLSIQSGPTAHHLGPIYLRPDCNLVPDKARYPPVEEIKKEVLSRIVQVDKEVKEANPIKVVADEESEIRARALSIVRGILHRLDTIPTSEFRRFHSTRIGDSLSTTTRDVSSDAELPVDEPLVDQGHTERSEVRDEVTEKVGRLFSKASQTLTSPSDDLAIIEDLERSEGLDANELDESSLSLKHPVVKHHLEGNTKHGLESLSMMVNHSTNIGHQIAPHEPALSNSTLSSDDNQEYSFKVLRKSPEATSRSQYEQSGIRTPKMALATEAPVVATNSKTALEWKLIRGAKGSGRTSAFENDHQDEVGLPTGPENSCVPERTPANDTIEHSKNREMMPENRITHAIPVINLLINKKKDIELPDQTRLLDHLPVSDIHQTSADKVASTSKIARSEGAHHDDTHSIQVTPGSPMHAPLPTTLHNAISDLSLSMQVNFQPSSTSSPIPITPPPLEATTPPTIRIRSISLEVSPNRRELPEQSSLSPKRESFDTSVGVNSIVTSERNIRINSSLEVHASWEDSPITPDHVNDDIEE